MYHHILTSAVLVPALMVAGQAHGQAPARTPKSSFKYVYEFVANNHGPEVPNAGALLDVGGALVGVTNQGGQLNDGTVYSVSPTGTLTLLHAFTGPDGELPLGGVVMDTAGNLYGTTSTGSTQSPVNNESGSVFKLAPDGTLTTLHAFTPAEGQMLNGIMRDSAGNIFGATTNILFEIAAGGSITTLYTFTDATRGGAIALDSNDNIYYTTAFAGPNDAGVIYAFPKGATMPTGLYAFNGADGYEPYALALDGGGNVYGTTYGGGNGNIGDRYGTVFALGKTGTLKTLHKFGGPDGSQPLAITVTKNGTIYGTTSAGGKNGYGTIYTLAAGGAFKTLYNFTQAGAAYPNAAPISGGRVLYGTTRAGSGQYDTGVVYSIKP